MHTHVPWLPGRLFAERPTGFLFPLPFGFGRGTGRFQFGLHRRGRPLTTADLPSVLQYLLFSHTRMDR